MMTAATIACLLLVLFHGGHGQLTLNFGGGAPQPPTMAPAGGGFDPNCADKLDNCELFDSSSCGGDYEDWARENCALTCQFCQGPPTSPPPCIDVADNCASYDTSACSNPDFTRWARENCRLTCRMCTDAQLQFIAAHSTTLSPESCVDKVECRLYGQSSCTGEFAGWARENCMNYCGFCQGVATTPAPCVDAVPNCDQYEDGMCTSADYRVWASDNCRRFCNFCTGGAPATASPGVMTPPPLGGPAVPPLPPGRK